MPRTTTLERARAAADCLAARLALPRAVHRRPVAAADLAELREYALELALLTCPVRIRRRFRTEPHGERPRDPDRTWRATFGALARALVRDHGLALAPRRDADGLDAADVLRLDGLDPVARKAAPFYTRAALRHYRRPRANLAELPHSLAAREHARAQLAYARAVADAYASRVEGGAA